MDARENRAAAVGNTLPNTREPVAEAAHSRDLYDTQLRLNATLVNDIAACKEGHAAQAEELAGLRDRDKAHAELMGLHGDLLKVWGERLGWLESLVIDLMEKDEQAAAIRHAMSERQQGLRMESRADMLTRRMAPTDK